MTSLTTPNNGIRVEVPVPWHAAWQMLRTLFQPDAVIHVGAGRGIGEIHAWRDWGVSRAWLIDADGERMAWARQMGGPEGWQVMEAVVAGKPGPVVFHQTNHPAEDGLLPPEQLSALWANLRTVSQVPAQACTLDEILGPGCTGGCAWLLIDCLAAEDILAGSLATLSGVQVVCARVVGQEGDQTIERLLAPRGFLRVARVESNHPHLGHVAFVRDLAARVEQLLLKWQTLRSENAAMGEALVNETRGKDEALKRLAGQTGAYANLETDRNALATKIQQLQAEHLALQADRETLANSRAAEARAHADLLGQHDALKQELKRAQAAHQTLSVEKDSLAAQRDAETESCIAELNEVKSAYDALRVERDVLVTARIADVKSKADLQARYEQETKERDTLQSKCQHEAEANIAMIDRLKVAEKNNAELIARIRELDEENADLKLRVGRMTEEIIRAEGQIDLIKDLVLRDSGL
jgi:hypothetical protein